MDYENLFTAVGNEVKFSFEINVLCYYSLLATNCVAFFLSIGMDKRYTLTRLVFNLLYPKL